MKRLYNHIYVHEQAQIISVQKLLHWLAYDLF